MPSEAVHPATFSDGRTAARHAASVTLADEDIAIRVGEDCVARWRYEDLRVVDDLPTSMRLCSRTQPDARLALADAEAVRAIAVLAPALRGRRGRGHLRNWAAALAAIVVVAGLFALVPILAKPIARLVPKDWEAAWGRHNLEILLPHLGGECAGQEGRQAIAALSRRVAAANALAGPFDIHIARSNEINAFALAGGHVVILDGLIDFARSADEVAAVLAHEMAHLHARHVTERIVRDTGLGMVVMFVTGDPTSFVGSTAVLLASLSYSRADEAEADAMGAAMLAKAGFAPQGMAEFFRRLAARGGALPAILSTHPPDLARAAAVEGTTTAGTPALTAEEWAAVKAACDS